MRQNSKNALEKSHYDIISKGYNKLHMEEQKIKLGIIKAHLRVRPFERLLDVGCGTGISSDFPCRVFCIDPSVEMLNLNPCRDKFLGKAEMLPFPDNFFDIVISVTAMHNFDDINKGLSEMRRVGKGRYVFSVLKKSQKFKIIRSMVEKGFCVKRVIEEDKDVIFFI